MRPFDLEKCQMTLGLCGALLIDLVTTLREVEFNGDDAE